MKVDVTGSTRIFAIVGDPIAQVRTPVVLNRLIREAGIDAILVPFHVPASRFAEVIGGVMGLANLDGLVVTYPFKERALGLVQESTERARMVGAVNAMRRGVDGRWVGDMFDGVGLCRAVASRRAIIGSNVLLIGAGGAGRAIGLALAEAGAAAITVVDLSAERAKTLVDRIRATYANCAAMQGAGSTRGHDIVINATPVGMRPGDAIPAQVAGFSASVTVVDIVLAGKPTPLLDRAAAEGAHVVSGSAIVEGQASVILDFLHSDRVL